MESISLYSIIISAGAVQAVFWSIALGFIENGKWKPNRLLSLLLFAFAIGLGYTALYESRYILRYPDLAGTSIPLFFIYPPLFYFYIRSLVQQPLTRPAAHFIPAVTFAITIVIVFFWLIPKQNATG